MGADDEVDVISFLTIRQSWKLLSILKSVIPSFENQFSYQISKNNKKQNNNDDTTLLELYEALHAYHYHLCLHHVVGTLIHVP